MPRPRRRPHDSAYKLLFSNKELVADLIRGYVDPASAGGLDLKTLEHCNGSNISPDLRERRNDMVWRVHSRQGWIYVYLLLEFQSTVNRYMAVRMLTYVALLWEDIIKQKLLTEDGRLPPVLPIGLYNGDDPWTAPVELQSLVAPMPAFLAPFQPQAKHVFLDENRASTSNELEARNLAAAAFALEQTAGAEAQNRLLKDLRAWLWNRPDLKEAFGTWYAEAIAPTGLLPVRPGAMISLDRVEPMMATRIMKDIERRVAEGKARGRAEGEARGRAEGEARGRVEAIHQLVRSGVLAIDVARTQVKAMLKAKLISREVAREALAKLG